MKKKLGLILLAVVFWFSPKAIAQTPDPNFYVFLAFGQSNMEGYPGIPAEDKTVDPRLRMLATVDFPNMERKTGNWYDAIPPLCRPSTGLCPADYFGRTLVANLPANIKVGIVNVSVAGCKIELFEKDTFKTYAATAAPWMVNIIKTYNDNPYQYLVDMGKLAQKQGVIKGILLHQGESNTNDREWPNKVKGIYDNLLKDLDLKADATPLLAGEVVNSVSFDQILAELPKTVPTAHVISSKGCEARQDRLHFTPAGYRELGTRYGEKMLSLMGYKFPERKPATQPATP